MALGWSPLWCFKRLGTAPLNKNSDAEAKKLSQEDCESSNGVKG